MAFMFLCRARLAIGLAGASLFAASSAFADSFPSGWTDDDAPQDVQQPAPAPLPVPKPQRQPPRPAAGQDLDHEPQQQPDPSWVAPDERAPNAATDQADPRSASGDIADNDPSALSAFDGALAGHGAWVDDPQYGRIWVPDSAEVGEGFAPYQTAGHWALDDQSEWLWVSDYSWGYVPFHYGRWLWVPARGWGWIPGRVYAPAWVSWRVGPSGYVGWAPMAPSYYWWRGAAVGFWHRPVSAYCFAPTGHVFARNVGAYVVRTPAGVRAAAAGTRAYTGASPTRVGAQGRMSPTPEQAHVSASVAASAHAHGDARAAAFAHSGASARASAHVTAHAGSYGQGAYGHGAFGHGSSAHAYGHAFNAGHGSSTLRTPQHASSSSTSSSSKTHTSSSGARSSGHASGHHR